MESVTQLEVLDKKKDLYDLIKDCRDDVFKLGKVNAFNRVSSMCDMAIDHFENISYSGKEVNQVVFDVYEGLLSLKKIYDARFSERVNIPTCTDFYYAQQKLQDELN